MKTVLPQAGGEAQPRRFADACLEPAKPFNLNSEVQATEFTENTERDEVCQHFARSPKG